MKQKLGPSAEQESGPVEEVAQGMWERLKIAAVENGGRLQTGFQQGCKL